MSTAPGGDAAELVEQFPLNPEQALALTDALSPLQDIAQAGASFGSAAKRAPGPGPKLVGVLLENVATHLDLISVSAETLARATAFYIESQVGSIQTLFPPPGEALTMLEQDLQPLEESIETIRAGRL